MAVLEQARPVEIARLRGRFLPLLWLALVALAILLWLWPSIAPWAVDYPMSWIVPITTYITLAMKWLVAHISVFTRGIASILQSSVR